MNIGMMQPTFLPWLGFFELIYKSDVFIFLDDFQFSVQSYHQRNRLFVNKGQVDWYTVPVQKSVSFGESLNKTLINEKTPWRTKMWKRIQQNYSKASYYSLVAPHVQVWLNETVDSLATQNESFIKLVCYLLGLRREFLRSSQFTSVAQRSERVLELLRLNNAYTYYCARGSFDYMLGDGVFPQNDVTVLFQDFQPKTYSQVGSPGNFIPYLSVLDALMNVGPQQTAELIFQGTPKWLSWGEMAARKIDLTQKGGPEETPA
ncbi:hypothetical protein C4544_01760 [candidate division WS5 bacterium]|uniref:WbqC family protein n=1 Tax=candidate division WS5 bacterium TaxID=2093353 RepID=A0A419DFD0_9BACT|nr:MAG: hypothetical protein C4544_01760 [candidate division WS5 bacterium]